MLKCFNMKIISIFIDLIKEYFIIGKLKLICFFHANIPPEWDKGTKGNILLIQGFNERAYFLNYLANRLNASGYRIIIFPFNTHASVKVIAEEITKKLSPLNLKNIVVVSHSKGGLIAKYLLDNYEEVNKMVEKVFTIATPYHGSILAHLRYGHLTELLPESQFIRNSHKINTNNCRIVNIYPQLDNHILPNSSLILDGAENIQIKVIGHTRIVEDPRTVKIILDKI